ncbi:hypothetical protein PVAP13_5NG027816 [Panicum virgatum]|uniref:Uncharacterized protein n=1 Tax=Panicum virgatum TaxID=38727 RepID=A0A8T0RNJ6_PANVG|nr:hypothetical protein PVAP13_5NG027816 [Panicum virgatum]
MPPPAAKPNSPAHEKQTFRLHYTCDRNQGRNKSGGLEAHRTDLVAPPQQRAISPPLPKRQSRSNASKSLSALALPQADPRPADPTGAAAAKGAARNDEAAAARGGGTPHARTAVCPAQARRRRDETGGRGSGGGEWRAAAACGRWARVAAGHRVGVAGRGTNGSLGLEGFGLTG